MTAPAATNERDNLARKHGPKAGKVQRHSSPGICPDGHTTNPEPPPSRATRMGERCIAAAFVLLVLAVTSRCFLPELPFQGSALEMLPGRALARAGITGPAPDATAKNALAYQADRSELSRMTYAVLLLSAGALWAIGGAIAGGLTIRHRYLAWAIGAFAALSLASALTACNRRAAMDSWIEQLSLMVMAFLAIQLCGNRRRFVTLVVVLAALAGTMAAKSYWQVAVESPQNVADFEAHRLERLAQFGWDVNTPQAQAVEGRLRDWSARGFFSLANPFGSLLLVLGFAGVGLAIDKFRAGAIQRHKAKGSSGDKAKAGGKPGEVEPTTVAALLAAILAGGVIPAIALTRSEGAMLATAIAGAALVAALLWGRHLARRWRACVALAIVAAVLGGGAVVAHGLYHDSLPTTTMTFRWYYWTASAKVLAERPLLGTGPANFGDAYLKHRRDQAEEDIQVPHNVVVHALSEYGLPGGACYLAVLGWLLLLAVRPRRKNALKGTLHAEPVRSDAVRRYPKELDADKYALTCTLQTGPARRGWPILAGVVAAVVAARLVLWGATDSTAIVLLHTIVPAAVLAAMLAMLAWSGRDMQGLPDSAGTRAARMAIGAAAIGFIIHNMVTYSLWLPGAASAFFLAIGAAAGRAGDDSPLTIIRGRWAVGAAAGAAVLAAVAIFWWPVASKTYHTAGMLAALRDGDVTAALAAARSAADADTLDPRPAADAADIAMMQAGRAGASAPGTVQLARDLAGEAIRRNPAHSGYYRLAGELAWTAETFRDRRLLVYGLAGDKAYLAGDRDKARQNWIAASKLLKPGQVNQLGVDNYERAVKLNPKSARLRISCANNYLSANLPSKAVEQLDEAWRLNKTLPLDSAQRLRPVELKRINALGARAAVLMGRRLGPTTTK